MLPSSGGASPWRACCRMTSRPAAGTRRVAVHRFAQRRKPDDARSQPLRYALSPPFAVEPGSQFNYNGGLTQVMAAVLERPAARPRCTSSARTRCSSPGIHDSSGSVTWPACPRPPRAAAARTRCCQVRVALPARRPLERKAGAAGRLGRAFDPAARPLPAASGRRRRRRVRLWLLLVVLLLPHGSGLIEARIALGNGQQRIYVLPGLDMVVTISRWPLQRLHYRRYARSGYCATM